MPAGHSKVNFPTGTLYYLVSTSLSFNFKSTATAAPRIKTNPIKFKFTLGSTWQSDFFAILLNVNFNREIYEAHILAEHIDEKYMYGFEFDVLCIEGIGP